MKIYMHEFNEYLGGLSHDDPAIQHKSVSGLAKYSNAEWQGTPDAIPTAVAALTARELERLRAACSHFRGRLWWRDRRGSVADNLLVLRARH